jgi:hypothetical protein
MERLPRVPLALALVLVATACTQRTVVVAPAPQAVRGSSTTATLRIPPGHLPPPGRCRVWIPGRPPGHQPPPRSCDGIAATAPAGAWIVYRPSGDRKHVHVRETHERRAGVVVRVRVFEAGSGRFVREEEP